MTMFNVALYNKLLSRATTPLVPTPTLGFKYFLCCFVGGYGFAGFFWPFKEMFYDEPKVMPPPVKTITTAKGEVNIYQDDEENGIYNLWANNIYVKDPTNGFIINHEVGHFLDRKLLISTEFFSSAMFMAASITQRIGLFLPIYCSHHIMRRWCEVRADKYSCTVSTIDELQKGSRAFQISHANNAIGLHSPYIPLSEKIRFLIFDGILDVHPSYISRIEMIEKYRREKEKIEN